MSEEKEVGAGELLGGGSDLSRKTVEYNGKVWTIKKKNYTGFWTVERLEEREDGIYRIRSSISPNVMPNDHPHFAKLI